MAPAAANGAMPSGKYFLRSLTGWIRRIGDHGEPAAVTAPATTAYFIAR